VNNISKQKIEFIGKSEENLKTEVKKMQDALLALILSSYLTKFSTTQGNLRFSGSNLSRVSINSIFKEFNKKYQIPLLQGLVTDLFKINKFHSEYFMEIASSAEILKITNQLKFLYTKLGISKGAIVKGGWLGNVVESAAIKDELQRYVINSLSQGKSLTEFAKGFEEIVVGSGEKSGILQKYYNQYVYDTYMQFERTGNNFYADKLGLNYFFYTGGLIETSREFCIKRDGKLFSRDDAKTWKNDVSLPQPSTKESYNPLIELGRWNCRHHLEWISDEAAKKYKSGK